MSPGSKLHLAALRNHLRRDGKDCVFAGTGFRGAIVRLKPDDPRLKGSEASLELLLAITDELPVTAPVRGDEITVNDQPYRISHLPPSQVEGTTEFLIALA